MDPLTIIVTALTAGAALAAKDVAGQAIKDGYTGLKTLIVRKFQNKPDVTQAVEQVEHKPESKGRQDTLKEELETAGAGNDAEIIEQAQALYDLIKKHEAATGDSYTATLVGSGAMAQGPGAVAAGSGGVAIGGSVQGGVHVPDRPAN